MSLEHQVPSLAAGKALPRRNHAIWVGVLLSLVGLLTYIPTVRVPALRDFPWINLPLMIAGVLVSALGLWRAVKQPLLYRGKRLSVVGLLVSLTLTGLFCYGLFLAAQLPALTETAQTLTRAPDFALSDQNGLPASLSSFRGKKLVVTFYRGYW
ncbi:MAG: hypothetical protein RMM98_07650 [Acidobacteriota bacterium]|nr:hypothetical protein [Acidobacteriota bacterium]